MSAKGKISLLKSKLSIYKLGLSKAETKGNLDEIEKWQNGISSLEKEIAGSLVK